MIRKRECDPAAPRAGPGLCTDQGPTRHFTNTLFNVMRGGVFPYGYRFPVEDFLHFVHQHHRPSRETVASALRTCDGPLSLHAALKLAEGSGDVDFCRLVHEYLPLTFSRRHGDPSRPWNHFSIALENDNGSEYLAYEGNWRDIFQNWEALAYSYPEYVESMICTFLNATTVDGYNPYRITRRGIDWEIPEPHNPWANIGYWSDHQVIYLQKLMEISARVHPGKLQAWASNTQ